MSLPALIAAARRVLGATALTPTERRTGIFVATRVVASPTPILDTEAERLWAELESDLDRIFARAMNDRRDYVYTITGSARAQEAGQGEVWRVSRVLLLETLADAAVGELVKCGGKWTEEVAEHLHDEKKLLQVRIPTSAERFEARAFTPALFRVSNGTKQLWAWERVR